MALPQGKPRLASTVAIRVGRSVGRSVGRQVGQTDSVRVACWWPVPDTTTSDSHRERRQPRTAALPPGEQTQANRRTGGRPDQQMGSEDWRHPNEKQGQPSEQIRTDRATVAAVAAVCEVASRQQLGRPDADDSRRRRPMDEKCRRRGRVRPAAASGQPTRRFVQSNASSDTNKGCLAGTSERG